MLTIIGLGSAGCNIAEMFEEYDTIKVKLIDVDIEGENCFSLPLYQNPEDYEKNLPNLNHFLSDCTKKILFIVAGSGKVSGASLRILSHLKDREISILYIRPDRQIISNIGEMQERLTFNVFQEYARSGVFEKVYLINNSNIENILGDNPVIGYNENLNKIIFNVVSGILSLDSKNPIINNFTAPKDTSRISTYGLYDLETDTERLFYNLEQIDDKCYYFIINEEILKTDGKLFKKIKETMKQKITNNIKISYKIFSSSSEINYCYVVNYSKKIQI